MNTVFASEVLKYHAFLAHNREVFLLNYREEVACWDQIADVFGALRAALATGRDDARKTHVSLLPFVLLAQRQTMVGQDALVSSQSHACWPLLRPLLEAALIMGKWLDDPQNATIWEHRQANRKAYRQAYTGEGLRSRSLPRSGDIQNALKRLNDDYQHMNERYYSTHIAVTHVDQGGYLVEVPMFDSDAAAHEAHVYAATHLLLVVLQSISEMLTARLGPSACVAVPITRYEALRLPRVVQLADGSAEHRSLLLELGLWPL